MKTCLIITVCCCLLSCREGKEGPRMTSRTDTALYFPYAPVYTSQFEKGNPLHVKTVLDLWKQFESGDVRNMASSFADSIQFILPGEIWKGNAKEVLVKWKKMRDRYQDVQCYIDSWMPILAKDKDEEMVWIWGRQDGTTAGGRRDYLVLHQAWWFNDSSRITRMIQYNTHPH